MESHDEVEIIDRNGWIRRHSLEQSITYIGSDPTSDIVLEIGRGGGVAPRHVQVIYWPDIDRGYRLVNLGDADIPVGSTGDQFLSPRAAMDLTDGETVRLGNFTLVFHLGAGPAGAVVGSSRHIGLGFNLPQVRLAPNGTLEGIITVRNLGEQESVQFELDLEGLPPHCYQIEPPPLFFPGAEEEVRLHLYHRGTQPVAGERYITIRATAPEAYPAEEATVSRTVQVLPLYQHQLRLLTEEEWRMENGEWRMEAGPPSPVKKEQVPETETAPPSKVAARDREAEASPTHQPEEIQPPEVKARPPEQAVEGEEWRMENGEWRVEEGHPPPQPETEQAPQASAGLPSQTKDWTAPEMQPGLPTPTSVWVAPEAEFGPPATPAEEGQPSEAEAAPLAEAVSPPQAEAEHLPAVETAPLPPPEKEQVPEAETVSPPQPEGVQVPEAETISPLRPTEAQAPEAKAISPVLSKVEGPPPLAETQPPEVEAMESPQVAEEDWWAEEAEADQPSPAEEDWWPAEAASPSQGSDGDLRPTQVRKVKTISPPQPEGVQSPEVAAAPSPQGSEEDWWTMETEAHPPLQSLRLGSGQAQGDWWGSTGEASPLARAKKVKVLKAEAVTDWEEIKIEAGSLPQEEENWWGTEDEANSSSEEAEE